MIADVGARRRVGVLAVLAVLIVVGVGAACPFCTMQGQTLTGEADEARMVLYGDLMNAQVLPQPNAPDGTTDLVIYDVIKKHDILDVATRKPAVGAGRPVLTLSRYQPPVEGDEKFLYLVFCDV